jgi:hypothetical protein
MIKLITTLIIIINLSSVAMSRDLTALPQQIEGTKISTEFEAKHIASDSYLKKMQLMVSATESMSDIDIIKLGFDMPGFAGQGKKIWEVRVRTIEGDLRAIIWINPNTGRVYFVTGPWNAGKFAGLDEANIVRMKSLDKLQQDWDELENRVSENPKLWEGIKQIYGADHQFDLPASKKIAIQQLYGMIQDPNIKASTARKALEIFINTDSKDIIREALINTRPDIDAWGLVIIASEAIIKTKDKNAIPYLIYVLAKNNYTQAISDDSTIHAIVKQKLITAIKMISDLNIDSNKINVDDPLEIKDVLSQARTWAKRNNIKLLDE